MFGNRVLSDSSYGGVVTMLGYLSRLSNGMKIHCAILYGICILDLIILNQILSYGVARWELLFWSDLR